MPSTRKRRIRQQKVPKVADWQLNFLLTGQEPTETEIQEQEINRFEVLIFGTARPGDPDCRFGRVEPWFRIWERIKNNSFVTNWRQQHGKPYAEQLLEEYNSEQA